MPKMPIKRVLLAFLLTCTLQILPAGTAGSAERPDFKVFVGEWVRPDGGYIIRVRDIKSDGSVDAGYYNPKEISIAEANVSEWKGMGKLFIKLQDEGYPGSTYTLYYYAEKDALAGFYYQAALGQTFEVVFMRE
jgi:hypothetical protein